MSTDPLAALAGSVRVFDLGHEMSAEMPQWPGHPPFIFSLVRRHGDAHRPGGFSSSNEVIVTSGHTGTHIDGLGHVSCDGFLFGEVNAAQAQLGGRGFQTHGIETIAPIVRRGVLLDIARYKGVDILPASYPISAEELKRVADARGVTIKKGDVVLIRTGWGRHWGDRATYVNTTTGWPGPDLTAANWMADREIFATGCDTITYEVMDPASPSLPVHVRLIAQAGIHLIENVALEDLAAAGVVDFLFVCLPLKFVGATGSPVRPVAIVSA